MKIVFRLRNKKCSDGSYVEQLKKNKVPFAVYVLLRTIVFAVMIFSVFRGNYENVFSCLWVLFLLLLPAVIEKKFGLELPGALEVIVMLFVFAALILGEMGNYYIKFPYWDAMLHTTNGFLSAAVGFGLVDILNRNEKIKFTLSPLFLALVAFCFSMTIGILWEFFEFACDVFLGMDMQNDTLVRTFSSSMLSGNTMDLVVVDGIREVLVNGEVLTTGGYLDIGLYDTMMDLVVNFIGAVIFSVFGYFYVKYRGKHKFAMMFVPRLKKGKKSDGKKTDEEECEGN